MLRHFRRSCWLRLVVATASFIVWLCIASFPLHASQPNFLFLFSDDQRPDTIAALGNNEINTPHLDRLVREGTSFTRAITAVPICVASRAELLTGRNGLRNGLDDQGFGPHPDAPRWAETLANAGYRTCYVGKWHTSGRPSGSGYQEVEALYAGGGGRWMPKDAVDWKGQAVTGYRGWVFQTDARKLFPEQGVGLTPDISETFADGAIRFIERRDEQPWFLHVNFTAPHDPLLMPTGYESVYQPADISLPENFAARHPFDHGNAGGRDEVLFQSPRTEQETRAALAVYYAVISHMDEQIGRVLAALEAAGQSENTVVIFSSDHGLAMGSHGLRGKQNMYEHSIGVPLVMRGPDIPADRRIDAQCYLRDLYPTACELAGVRIPDTVDGRSLVPLLTGEDDQIYPAVFAHFRDSQRAIRTERWKYIRYPLVDEEQLFDLENDSAERQNLINSDEHRHVANDLRRRLNAWQKRFDVP